MIALRFSRQSLNDRLFNLIFLVFSSSRQKTRSLVLVMERPPAMLAAVELALVVDGVHDQVKRRPLSAFGAADGGTLQILMRIVGHCYLPLLALGLNDAPRIIRLGILMANLQNFSHSCKSKMPSDAFFVNSATVFVNSATPRGRAPAAPSGS